MDSLRGRLSCNIICLSWKSRPAKRAQSRHVNSKKYLNGIERITAERKETKNIIHSSVCRGKTSKKISKWHNIAGKPEPIIFERLLSNILATFGHFWEQRFSFLGAQSGKACPSMPEKIKTARTFGDFLILCTATYFILKQMSHKAKISATPKLFLAESQ